MDTPEKRLKVVRTTLGYSQKVFSQMLNVASYSLRDIELGKNKITNDIIHFLVHQFNINTNWLLFGEGEMFQKSTEITHKKNINGDNNVVNLGNVNGSVVGKGNIYASQNLSQYEIQSSMNCDISDKKQSLLNSLISKATQVKDEFHLEYILAKLDNFLMEEKLQQRQHTPIY